MHPKFVVNDGPIHDPHAALVSDVLFLTRRRSATWWRRSRQHPRRRPARWFRRRV